MLSFLCILLGTFQFALLLMVTGILLSLAIVSRLMEIVITLIHPTSIFLLRQSVKLFVLITSLSAKMTGYVWCKTMKRINAGEHHQEENLGIMISLTGPKILYRRIVNSFVKNHVYMEPLQLNVLNNDKLPPDLPSNGQESKIDSKEEESIPDSKEEESISVSKEEESISVSKEEESISVSKEEESISVSKEEESISVSKEEEIISDSKEEESISNSKEEESTSNSKEDVDAV